MDIENLRKIQETEKALRIHNINISTGEAVSSVKNDINVGGTKVPSFDDASNIPSSQVLRAKEEAHQNQIAKKEVSQMDEQQMKKELSEQADLIAKQAKLIYELQGAVNEIIKEIRKMQGSVATKNPAERQQVLKPEERTQHPRSGGYKSEDVSVEKFFNFSGTR
ncbi:hypothetical protein JXB27_01150 [Candidatus Woesearchaeota archaeon]|nr:hypothetical protein [Candidatus Woesearchaeota archaeon]